MRPGSCASGALVLGLRREERRIAHRGLDPRNGGGRALRRTASDESSHEAVSDKQPVRMQQHREEPVRLVGDGAKAAVVEPRVHAP
jgi:hypothetical protein